MPFPRGRVLLSGHLDLLPRPLGSPEKGREKGPAHWIGLRGRRTPSTMTASPAARVIGGCAVALEKGHVTASAPTCWVVILRCDAAVVTDDLPCP